MGELLAIDPDLHFPLLTVFDNGDGFTKRGRFFFRDQYGILHGPYQTETAAAHDMVILCPGALSPVRTPFECDDLWWWKRDDPSGHVVEGPYEFEVEAEFAITRYTNELKDKARS